MPDQMVQDIAHEPVDRLIQRRRSGPDLPLTLNVPLLHELAVAPLKYGAYALGRHLEMELKANHVLFQPKRLIRASVALGEPHGASVP